MKALERYQKAGWTLKLCAKIIVYIYGYGQFSWGDTVLSDYMKKNFFNH